MHRMQWQILHRDLWGLAKGLRGDEMTMWISLLLDREGDHHRCLRRGDSPPGQQIPGPSASLPAAPDLLCVVDTAEDEIALLMAILEKSKVVDKKTVIILLSCIVEGSRFRKRRFLLEENAKGIEGPVSCPSCPVYKWTRQAII